MKKSNLMLFFCCSTMFVLSSCQDKYDILAEDIERQSDHKIENISIANDGNIEMLAQIVNDNNLQTRSAQDSRIMFDSKKISKHKIANKSFEYYIIPQVNFSSDNEENFYCGYVVDNHKVKASIIMKEELVAGNRKKITYFKNDSTPFISIIIDKANNTVYSENFVDTPVVLTRSEGVGDCVSRCISDAYLEDGWGSVALWCATLYCPEIGVAVALYCTSLCGSK